MLKILHSGKLREAVVGGSTPNQCYTAAPLPTLIGMNRGGKNSEVASVSEILSSHTSYISPGVEWEKRAHKLQRRAVYRLRRINKACHRRKSKSVT